MTLNGIASLSSISSLTHPLMKFHFHLYSNTLPFAMLLYTSIPSTDIVYFPLEVAKREMIETQVSAYGLQRTIK